LIFQWFIYIYVFIAEHTIPPFLIYMGVSVGVIPPS